MYYSFVAFVHLFKKVMSFGLLVFSSVVITVIIFENETFLSEKLGAPFAFCAFWMAMIWLARIEGGQPCMVGLPPVDRKLYEDTHPIAYNICEYGHSGDNMERYLMGRQFLVLAMVFVINMAGAPTHDSSDRQTAVAQLFADYGLALVLVTAMVGQLFTQVTASYCMLDYINTHFQTVTLSACMAVEASGILHASYLIQYIAALLTGKSVESNEAPRTVIQNIFFWGRVLFSLTILTLAFVVTLSAMFEGKTTTWEGMPTGVSIALFFFLMSVVGMLEGMQIAFFAVAKLTEEERNSNVWSTRTCTLLFGDDGMGLPGFLIGRQLSVAACFFGIARISTVRVEDGEENVLGVSDGVQGFFETGLLGAIITTIVASTMWQLVASAFPLSFLGNPVSFVMLRFCLLVESTGVCSFAWVLSEIQQEFMSFMEDEEYIGTAMERAAKGKGDTKGTHFTANMGLPSRHKVKMPKLDPNAISDDELREHIGEMKKHMLTAKNEKEREALEREIHVMENVLKEHHINNKV